MGSRPFQRSALEASLPCRFASVPVEQELSLESTSKMPPSLTTEMTIKGPQVLLSTLTKHYFGTHDADSTANEELLYASGFRLVKASILVNYTLFNSLMLMYSPSWKHLASTSDYPFPVHGRRANGAELSSSLRSS